MADSILSGTGIGYDSGTSSIPFENIGSVTQNISGQQTELKNLGNAKILQQITGSTNYAFICGQITTIRVYSYVSTLPVTVRLNTSMNASLSVKREAYNNIADLIGFPYYDIGLLTQLVFAINSNSGYFDRIQIQLYGIQIS